MVNAIPTMHGREAQNAFRKCRVLHIDLHYQAQPMGPACVYCYSFVGGAFIIQRTRLSQSKHEIFSQDTSSIKSLVLRKKLSFAVAVRWSFKVRV